jgi:hypothetical protein
MWDVNVPSVNEELRQGDLLTDLMLPNLDMPISWVNPTGGPNPIAAFGKMKWATYLVVTPCCTIENFHQIALAPVYNFGIKDRSVKAAMVEPDQNLMPNGYVFRSHYLEPIEGLLKESDRFVSAADLTQIATYGGDYAILRESARP